MFIAEPDAASTADFFAVHARSQGFLMNLVRAWAWRPDVFDGFAALRSRLTSDAALSARDQAVLVCATAAARRDSYCALAWSRNLSREAGADVAAAVIAGSDHGSLAPRDRALAQWARRVASDPNGTTQGDVDALRAAGLDDRQIFEATTFVAFRLAFSTINGALGVAPDPQLLDQVPAEVRTVVDFGRAVAPA